MISAFRTFLKPALSLCLFFSSTAYGADKLVIGVIPEVNLVRQMERYVPLSEYLDKRSGMDVEIKPLSNYGQLFEELRDGKVDGGFFGSLVYGITNARIGITPIARPLQTSGKSTYTGLIFVAREAGIRKPSDMRGKTIALADPATTGGYLAQKEYFLDHGINMDKELRILWTGSHEASIRAVLNHQADIGGAKNTIVAKFRKENRVFDTLIKVIHEGPKDGVPDNTLAVRSGLEPVKINRLKKTLLEMHRTPEGKRVLEKFGAVKFIETANGDFKPLYDLARHLNIEMKNYPYKKEQNTTYLQK